MEQFTIKTTINFGENALDRLISLPYKRVLVVTDPFIAQNGMIKNITQRLDKGNIEYRLFTDVVPDPPIDKISLGVKAISEYNPEAMIALGGGSSIDSAKAMNMVYSQITKSNTVPLVAIPTTSGTGSEVTSFAVISDPKVNCKYPLVDNNMLPVETILDAELVKSVPANITANTGMDVLTHAIEAFVSLNHNDFSDALAEKAIELCGEYLLRSYADCNDTVAREKMHTASCLAGLAFNSVSLGLNHGIAHTIGAHFHIPHGQANAMLLPSVVEFNSGVTSITKKHDECNPCITRYGRIANALGLSAPYVVHSVRALINWLNFMIREMKIPSKISECGVDKYKYFSEIDQMADRALLDTCTATNPVVPTKEDIKRLLTEIY
jgi:alcohol dehydrogenase class IV